MGTERNQENADRKAGFQRRRIVMLALCIVILVLFMILWKDIRTDGFPDGLGSVLAGREGKVTAVTAASIEKVFEISELSTAEYIYNAIARAYGEDGTSVKYYVAYEGTIKAGIDFSEIEVTVSEEEKTITLSLPKVQIQEATVDPGTLEYIFIDKKSESETIHKEAFELCQKDLEEKANSEEELLSLAKSNAETMVRALIKPWVMQVDSEFVIKFE